MGGREVTLITIGVLAMGYVLVYFRFGFMWGMLVFIMCIALSMMIMSMVAVIITADVRQKACERGEVVQFPRDKYVEILPIVGLITFLVVCTAFLFLTLVIDPAFVLFPVDSQPLHTFGFKNGLRFHALANHTTKLRRIKYQV